VALSPPYEPVKQEEYSELVGHKCSAGKPFSPEPFLVVVLAWTGTGKDACFCCVGLQIKFRTMSSTLLSTFEQYQKARVQFVQAVAEAATRPQNIDTMQNAGVMQLLRPLLLDNVSIIVCDGGNLALRTSVFAQVPSIQQTAALALGRLANYSDDLAEAVVANEILPQLVYSLGEQNVGARHCGYCSQSGLMQTSCAAQSIAQEHL